MKVNEEDTLKKNLEEIANSELSLLLLCQLLEGDKNAHIFSIPEITKHQADNFPEAVREFNDTNDHRSVYDLATYKIREILEGLQLGKIQSYIIWDLEEATDNLFQIMRDAPNETYKPLLELVKKANEQLVILQIENRKKRENALEEDSENLSALFDESVEMDANTFESEFDETFNLLPEHIGINVSLNKTQAQKIRALLAEYIIDFAEDKYYWAHGDYQNRRNYFSKQIDTFYQYLTSLSSINRSYNIPFSILANESFEIVKILKYLEVIGKIKMYWSDKSSWKIELSTPLTSPQDLLDESLSSKVQIFLRYSEPESILSYGKDKLKITGADQRFLLKTLFKNLDDAQKEWEFSEVCEHFDGLETPPEKKFYNASRQIIRRFKENYDVKNVLITTSHSVRINPEYLEKS